MLDNGEMNHKSSVLFSSGWVTYIVIMTISLWGGLVSYFERKVRFSWGSLVAHLTSSSFAGMMTFFACEYAGISGPLTGVLCGVAAHMGTPALIRFASKLKIVRDAIEGATVKKEQNEQSNSSAS